MSKFIAPILRSLIKLAGAALLVGGLLLSMDLALRLTSQPGSAGLVSLVQLAAAGYRQADEAGPRPAQAQFVSPVNGGDRSGSRRGLATLAGWLFSPAGAPGDPIQVDIGTLPAGKSVTIRLRATVNNPLPAGVQQVSNQGRVTGSGGLNLLTDDPDTAASGDPTVTLVDTKTDLEISQTVSPTTLTYGQEITYTLTFTNTGPNTAAGVVLTDTIPASVTVMEAAATGVVVTDTEQTPAYVWEVQNLAPGESGIITITGWVNSADPASFDNTAVISAASGDHIPANNSSTTSASVSPAETTTVMTSDSPDPTVAGETITVQFQVAAGSPYGGPPTGDVIVSSGTASCTAPAAAGSCELALPEAGSYSLTAAYPGDGKNFLPSSSAPAAHTVLPAGTTTSLDSSANPSVYGQEVTFTSAVQVVSPGSGTPTGSVIFSASGTAIPGCTDRPLSGGEATCTIDSLAIGSAAITAAYIGDANFDPSTSAVLTQQAVQAGTTTSLAAPAGASVWGQPVTFTATVQVTAPGAGTPTGEIVFRDGAASLGSVPLDASGTASLTVANLEAGSHSITAWYSGDDHFQASSSGAAGHTVDPASTSTFVIPPVMPTIWGQPATFIAIINVDPPGTGTPTGAVAFRVGVTAIPGCESIPLSENTASCTVDSLAAGIHNLTAEYTGDERFAASLSTFTHLVVPAGTETSLVSGNNPSELGAAVTFTATVQVMEPGAGIPTGSVIFRDGATGLGSAALDANGQAAFSTASLAVGSHDIRAEYTGDANALGSLSAVLQQTVSAMQATITLAASPNPSVWGQTVALTATLSAPASGPGTPTGSVTFRSGSTDLGTAALDASGQAGLSIHTLGVGSHELTVTYSGDDNFLSGASDPAVIQIVNSASTATTLAGSGSPTVWGETVTFTATVQAIPPGAGLPTGEVVFRDGETELGRASLDGDGAATFSTAALPAGMHGITAQYSGDDYFEPGAASATLDHLVNRAGTSTTLATSGSPTVWDEAVTLTAAVAALPPGAGIPSGEVTFRDGEILLGSAALDSAGEAVFSTTGLAPGSHALTAAYTGDGNFLSSESTPAAHTVDRAETGVALDSSVNPSVYGQPVTLNASVTVLPPGAGTPTGEVTFLDGSAELGTASLDAAGRARLTTSTLDAGSHDLTAVYAGDENFLDSASPAYELSVNRADTSASLVSSGSPTVLGETVTFTASIAVLPPGAGEPGGEVTFLDGSTELGVTSLDASGQAVFSTGALASGAHTITARYSGDSRFAGSASAALTHVVGDQVDLALTKTTKEKTFLAGSTQVYRLSIANAGPSAATQVVVTDTLPANLAFVAASNGCEAAGALVTCGVDALPAGAEASFTLTVTVGLDASGVVVNTARAAAAEVDVQPANNTASVTTPVSPAAVAYEGDFEEEPGDEWSSPTTSTTPSGETFLGEFSNGPVTLTLQDLPAHNRVTVFFRLFILRSWDGNQSEIPPGAAHLVARQTTGGIGPDEWSFQADGRTLLHTTFSNWDRMSFTQAYPGPYPGGDYPARTGAQEGGSLGYSYNGAPFMDSVYTLTYTFDHVEDALELVFAARGLQSIEDESWGLDNVQVRLSGAPLLGPGRLYLPLAVK